MENTRGCGCGCGINGICDFIQDNFCMILILVLVLVCCGDNNKGCC